MDAPEVLAVEDLVLAVSEAGGADRGGGIGGVVHLHHRGGVRGRVQGLGIADGVGDIVIAGGEKQGEGPTLFVVKGETFPVGLLELGPRRRRALDGGWADFLAVGDIAGNRQEIEIPEGLACLDPVVRGGRQGGQAIHRPHRLPVDHHRGHRA